MAYDQNRCIKQLNNLAMYHNNRLQEAIEELKKEFPNTVILYGDYYNAYHWLFTNAPYLGEFLYCTIMKFMVEKLRLLMLIIRFFYFEYRIW